MKSISLSIIGFIFLIFLNNNLLGQKDQYLLGFDNQQISGNQLCIEVSMGFKQSGRLGSSNLVLEFNKEQLINPTFVSDELPDTDYLISSFTNPVDSLASFNIELLSENNGYNISVAPTNTKIGEICFDQLVGTGPIVLDWVVKNTNKTVVYLDDESTSLQNGPFEVLCNNSGDPCDDGDPNTEEDQYDINCLCAGIQRTCIDDIDISIDRIPARTYKSNTVIISEGLVRNRAVVEFRANTSITLNPGFHSEEGSDFLAIIDDCVDNLIPEVIPSKIAKNKNNNTVESVALQIYPNPLQSDAIISYTLPDQQQIEIGLYNLQGQKLKQILSATREAGVHIINWQVQEFLAGMYLLRMKSGKEQLVKKIIIE